MTWGLDLGVIVATFLVIAPAELPDKSLLTTVVLSTRYPRLPVWIGAAGAFLVQMAIAVVAGQLLALLPRPLVLAASAALFAAFAVAMIRGGLSARAAADLAEEEAEVEAQVEAQGDSPTARASGRHAAAVSFALLFAAEWGDLTQLIAAAQSARTGLPLSVFVGSWLALALVAALGVAVGSWLEARVPLWRIRLISGAVLAVLAAVTTAELIQQVTG